VVDDDNIDGGFGGSLLEAELLLNGVEDVWGGTSIGREGVVSVGEGEIIPARQSRLIHNLPILHGNPQGGDEVLHPPVSKWGRSEPVFKELDLTFRSAQGAAMAASSAGSRPATSEASVRGAYISG